VIPQAVAAFLLAFMTKRYFHGEMMNTIFAGGVLMLTGAAISLLIYFKEQKNKEKN
jgi:maltose/moltooligosaccharide transporter